MLLKHTKNIASLKIKRNIWLVQEKAVITRLIFISIANAVSTEVASNLLLGSGNDLPPIKYLPSSGIKLLLSDLLIILQFALPCIEN